MSFIYSELRCHDSGANKGRCGLEVKMSRIEGGGDCECCGFYIDEYLTVTVDEVVIGEYSTDGHFGYSRINDDQVEGDIAQAVGADMGYVAFCASRKAQYERIHASMDAANTDDEIEAVNKAYAAAERSFTEWLKSLGHVVIEEFDVAETPGYDDDDYGDV